MKNLEIDVTLFGADSLTNGAILGCRGFILDIFAFGEGFQIQAGGSGPISEISKDIAVEAWLDLNSSLKVDLFCSRLARKHVS